MRISEAGDQIVLAPVKLERGATYIVEYPGVLRPEHLKEICDRLDREGKRAGVRFILLEAGTKATRRADA